MVNYKDWNMKHFGHVLLLSLVLVLIIAMVHVLVLPFVGTIFTTVGFSTTISLTDILLFLILLRLILK